MSALLAALAAAALAWVATGALLKQLAAKDILDHPNERSSHERPTPRGGGIAVVAVILLGWLLLAAVEIAPWRLIWPMVGLSVGLALVSWADDLRGLSPLPRFAAQLAAVAIALSTVPLGPHFPGPLPLWLALGGAALAWLWFVNLFNFMDGIDAIAGVEAIAIAAGIGAIAAGLGLVDGTPWLAAVVAGAALGFLPWNRPPARIFLGDVGSVPLGFLLGWLLLSLAAHGAWAAALILPAYFLADATLTLLRRALRGEKPWQAHREHFYQQAVRKGASHGRVSASVAVANLALFACALASLHGPGT
ncbi:MAG: glycosyltransferase family 4 protein, partial [Alphaproteobacteria bacterium]|nr:glycosyltransferase family 4 protein [Alphaproteobacteria bacterium]